MPTPRPKKLHRDGDCEEVLANGHLCAQWAMFTMTRIDRTTMALCTRHANQLRDLHAAQPEKFNPVKFTTVK